MTHSFGVCRTSEGVVLKMKHFKWILGIRGTLNDLLLAVSRLRYSHKSLGVKEILFLVQESSDILGYKLRIWRFFTKSALLHRNVAGAIPQGV